ncbi:sporulation histidine kinase inhibitor Sda [Bacillus sp. FJAT-44742]|uniref:sporulation histidine kinase inhibitor Sda n=1 Tax=Bacillus sp. FJAT-44742 TaxID=2014005 RepID=UPI000C23AFDF|nr:sporulation histidine kinase inhibitor Sda [Bacillus sp. FJAT-44742]
MIITFHPRSTYDKKSFRYTSDESLLEIYNLALEKKVDEDFLQLFRKEIKRRGLEITNDVTNITLNNGNNLTIFLFLCCILVIV